MGEDIERKKIWADDLLGRERDATLLYNFIVNRIHERRNAGRQGSYVMNIDAGWGHGKSFFLERFYQQVLASGHPAVFINAWRDDFSDDPFTSVLSEFANYIDDFDAKSKNKSQIANTLEAAKKNASKIMWTAAKGVAGKLAEKAIGNAKEEILELITEASPEVGGSTSDIADAGSKALAKAVSDVIDEFANKKIEEFNSAKESIGNFEKNFGQIVEALAVDGKEMPFFIFIDELDRCRPTYAISMLERIKHLFNVDNVVFLIATDTDQLCEAIKAVYGQGFGSRKYLGRFFNRPYVLPNPDRYSLVQSLFIQYNLNVNRLYLPFAMKDHAEVVTVISEHFDLDIRQLEHAVDVLASVVTTWNRTVGVDLLVIFPLIIGVLEKEPLGTPREKMGMFNRKDKFGQELKLKGSSVLPESTLIVAKWAEAYFRYTVGKALRQSMDEVANYIGSFNNTASRPDPVVTEIYRRLQAEFDSRGPLEESLIAEYVDIIQSMKSFSSDEDVEKFR